jgi:hypothetical protein
MPRHPLPTTSCGRRLVEAEDAPGSAVVVRLDDVETLRDRDSAGTRRASPGRRRPGLCRCRRSASPEARRRRASFISTRTTFGTAIDITVAELSIESLFPTDDATGEAMRSLLV